MSYVPPANVEVSELEITRAGFRPERRVITLPDLATGVRVRETRTVWVHPQYTGLGLYIAPLMTGLKTPFGDNCFTNTCVLLMDPAADKVITTAPSAGVALSIWTRLREHPCPPPIEAVVEAAEEAWRDFLIVQTIPAVEA